MSSCEIMPITPEIEQTPGKTVKRKSSGSKQKSIGSKRPRKVFQPKTATLTEAMRDSDAIFQEVQDQVVTRLRAGQDQSMDSLPNMKDLNQLVTMMKRIQDARRQALLLVEAEAPRRDNEPLSPELQTAVNNLRALTAEMDDEDAE